MTEPIYPKVSWPQYCRAAAQVDAYSNVLDWLARLSVDEVRRRIAGKLEQKQQVCTDYQKEHHA